jgi:hypothetical protein
MQTDFDGATARDGLRAIGRYLLVPFGRVGRGRSWLAERARDAGPVVGRRVGSLKRTLSDHLSAALEAETTKRVLGGVTAGLLGVRREVSVAALLAAPLLALGTVWWVVTTTSYRRIESMAVGTWTGTNPAPLVFLGVAAIVGLAALFTALNSGLIPATVLAMAPTFGIGFARYGLTAEYYGTVGIPDATAIGAMVAAAIGLPLGLTGFATGTVVRRAVRYLDGRVGGDEASLWR